MALKLNITTLVCQNPTCAFSGAEGKPWLEDGGRRDGPVGGTSRGQNDGVVEVLPSGFGRRGQRRQLRRLGARRGSAGFTSGERQRGLRPALGASARHAGKNLRDDGKHFMLLVFINSQ